MSYSPSASRFEARIAFELALEARFPRLIAKKPSVGGAPIDLYLLHQSVLRWGGVRRVELDDLWERFAEYVRSFSRARTSASFADAVGCAVCDCICVHAHPAAARVNIRAFKVASSRQEALISRLSAPRFPAQLSRRQFGWRSHLGGYRPSRYSATA